VRVPHVPSVAARDWHRCSAPISRQAFAATACAIGFSMASCRTTSGTP
jgi:hypothetical protein